MRQLPVKLAVTGSVAALLVALPLSIQVSRTTATVPGHAGALSLRIQCDTAQAVVGRPGTPGSVAGVARRSTRRTVRRHY
jgi:hypothetical protein